MRQSITGRNFPATKRIFSSGTSESSVMLWLPRTAMYACIFFIRASSMRAGGDELALFHLKGELARDSRTVDLQKRYPAGLPGGTNQRNTHLVRHIKELDKNGFALLQLGGVTNENAR